MPYVRRDGGEEDGVLEDHEAHDLHERLFAAHHEEEADERRRDRHRQARREDRDARAEQRARVWLNAITTSAPHTSMPAGTPKYGSVSSAPPPRSVVCAAGSGS